MFGLVLVPEPFNPRRLAMYYVGLDVHQKRSVLCILDESGRRVKEIIVRGPWSKLFEALADLDQPFAICYEASCGYGYLYDHLRRIARRVVVAHPGQLRLIFRSKRKNDRVDAEKLAKLLYLGEIPTVHVPSIDIRSWRAIIEHRTRLIAKRVRAKNGIRALLRSGGVMAPRGLWGKRGRRWLRDLELEQTTDRLRLDLLLDELSHFDQQLHRVEVELNRRIDQHPGVHLLMTIPGTGRRTAEAFMAYIDQPDRFTHNKAIGSYLGLVPCQDQSASNNRLGHITGNGPATVRKLLAEAAWQGVRRSPTIRQYFQRVIGNNPQKKKKIALVATAHYLARVMLAMLRTGETWHESLPAAA
jgi:transposase